MKASITHKGLEYQENWRKGPNEAASNVKAFFQNPRTREEVKEGKVWGIDGTFKAWGWRITTESLVCLCFLAYKLIGKYWTCTRDSRICTRTSSALILFGPLQGRIRELMHAICYNKSILLCANELSLASHRRDIRSPLPSRMARG